MTKKNPLWVTIYTDAGFKDGRGTWGVWIRTTNERIIKNGVCHPNIKDSNLAEMYAILAGVIIVLRTYPDMNIDGILIKSDSRTAINWAKWNGQQPRNAAAAKMRARLWLMLEERDCRIRCVWVKGHQNPGRGTAAFLNNAVDLLATDARDGQKGVVDIRHRVSAPQGVEQPLPDIL